MARCPICGEQAYSLALVAPMFVGIGAEQHRCHQATIDAIDAEDESEPDPEERPRHYGDRLRDGMRMLRMNG